jgi:glycosyltransferase involved in cell wall biosynthesis
MRILLAANASYVPPRGGSTRSNLAWIDRLTAAGHVCRIVASGAEFARYGAIEVHAALEPARRSQLLRRQVAEFRPDWLLVSSEDVGHVLIREAHQCAPGRVVYLAHTPQFFPFGPESWNPDPHASELVAQSSAIVVLSHYMAAYVERHVGRRAEIIHPPIYGAGPFPDCASFDSGLVTIINPCAVKGIGIFLALARRFPQVAFGALPGWGTTSNDLAALRTLPNIALLPTCPDIGDILSKTRVLLVPSLWIEGFGLVVMEAQLRGLPVIASDAGGLPEAKAGTGFVIPVQPIERYDPVFDERGMPKPVTAPQNIEPWADALSALLTDRTLYERESAAARAAAGHFLSSLNPSRMTEFLATLRPAPAEPPPTEAGRDATLQNLSPEKRALLLRRLRQRAANPH